MNLYRFEFRGYDTICGVTNIGLEHIVSKPILAQVLLIGVCHGELYSYIDLDFNMYEHSQHYLSMKSTILEHLRNNTIENILE